MRPLKGNRRPGDETGAAAKDISRGTTGEYNGPVTNATARVLENADGSARMMVGNAVLAEKPSRQARRRTESRFSIELLRLREIEAIISSRHGGPVPDPEDTDDRDTCLAYIRAAAMTVSGQDMAAWCRVWAPWVASSDLVPIVAEAARRSRMIRADGVAGLLHVTMTERTNLGLRTIGASDLSKSARTKLAKDRKRERDREQKEATRRAEGRQERASQRATSLAALKPWEAEGVSRRTWYRRRGTAVSRIDIYKIGDTRVPNPLQEAAQGQVAGCVAPGDRGSGTVSPAGCQGAEPHGRDELQRGEAA